MKNLLILFSFIASTSLAAQEMNPFDSSAVTTIDGIVNEILKITSGKKGKVRNWEAYRNLFLPNAQFTILYHDNTAFNTPVETASLEEMVEMMQDQYYEDGFTEHELGKVIDEYNGIAQVFQSFYVKDSEGEAAKGVTSYQLAYFKNRWWIVNVLWTTDTNGVKIPEKYINEKKQ